VCGRSGRRHDYPVWVKTSMLVQREVATLLRFSPRWKRSGQVYSHNVITWFDQNLIVNVFFLNYSRRRFRVYQQQRRRLKRLSSLRKLLSALVCSSLPKKNKKIKKVNRFHRRMISTRLLNWTQRFIWSQRKRHFNLEHALPQKTRFNQRRRWLNLVWRIRHRRQLRRLNAVRLWCNQKSLFYGVPLHLKWKRLAKVCSVNTVLALMVYRLRGRFTRRVNLMARPLMQLTKRIPGIKGLHLRCAGRFTRHERADHKVFKWGVLGRSDLGQPLQQGRWVVPLKFGTVSLTLTVSLTSYARK